MGGSCEHVCRRLMTHHVTLVLLEDLYLWMVSRLALARVLLNLPFVFELFVLFIVYARKHVVLGGMVMLGRQYRLLAQLMLQRTSCNLINVVVATSLTVEHAQ